MVRCPGRVVAVALGLTAVLAACGAGTTADPLVAADADGSVVTAAADMEAGGMAATEPAPEPTMTTTGPSVVAVADGGIRLPAASGQESQAPIVVDPGDAAAPSGPSTSPPTTPTTVMPATVAPESTAAPPTSASSTSASTTLATSSTTAPSTTAPTSTAPPTTEPPTTGPTTMPPAAVVEFRIAAGTGAGPWNSFESPVRVTVGQILRIHNDDNVAHGLHASGSPFDHGPQIQPGASRDHLIIAPHTPNQGSPRVYDHVAGRGAPFWIVATTP